MLQANWYTRILAYQLEMSPLHYIKGVRIFCVRVEWYLLLSYTSFIAKACAISLKDNVKAAFCSKWLALFPGVPPHAAKWRHLPLQPMNYQQLFTQLVFNYCSSSFSVGLWISFCAGITPCGAICITQSIRKCHFYLVCFCWSVNSHSRCKAWGILCSFCTFIQNLNGSSGRRFNIFHEGNRRARNTTNSSLRFVQSVKQPEFLIKQ